MDYRVIFSDNGTLTDYSKELNDEFANNVSITPVAAEDVLYIGARHPFNTLYFKTAIKNTTASNMSVQIYNGTEFIDVAEVIDYTSKSSKTLGQSGRIIITPKDDEASWASEDTDEIDAFSTLTNVIYGMYWMKITFSANMSAMSLSWIGRIFCTDDDLEVEYPDTAKSAFKTGHTSGKTDWYDQHVAASKLLIQDLERKARIKDHMQILRYEELTKACVPKVMEVIYGAFGDKFKDNKLQANIEYKRRLKGLALTLDKFRDAREQVYEQKTRISRQYR